MKRLALAVLLIAVPCQAQVRNQTIHLGFTNNTPYRCRFNYRFYPNQGETNHAFFLKAGHLGRSAIHPRLKVEQTLYWQILVFPPKAPAIEVNCGIYPHDPLTVPPPADGAPPVQDIELSVEGNVQQGLSCTTNRL